MMVGCLWDLGIQSEVGGKGFLSGLLFLILLFLAGIVLFLLEIPQRLYPDLTPLSILRTLRSLMFADGVLCLHAVFY